MTEPAVVNAADLEWEGWPEDEADQRAAVTWKTLISAGVTPSNELTFGVARVPPDAVLEEHRHEQAEIYFVLEGAGTVTINGSPRRIERGMAVFIPGNALHKLECAGDGDLHFAYAFATDAFEDVEYVFSE